MTKAEFAALFDEHALAVLSYLRRRTDAASADDALSETFLVAWRRRAEIPSRPLPWLYGVARRVLLNEVRGAGRRADLVARIAYEPAAAPREDGLSDATLGALQSLSVADREVLLLDAWEELSAKDAARVLGCLPATYSVRLHRASQRFKAAYASREPSASSPSPRTSESPS